MLVIDVMKISAVVSLRAVVLAEEEEEEEIEEEDFDDLDAPDEATALSTQQVRGTLHDPNAVPQTSFTLHLWQAICSSRVLEHITKEN